MIIHSPVISGSLTFADGATFTLPDNGIYSGSFSGSLQVHKVQSDLIPDVSGAYDLGSEAYPFQDLWLVGNTLNIGGISIGTGNALSGGPGLNIKNKSNNNPVEIAAKSITIGGLLGGSGTKSFKLNDNGNIEARDENDNIDTIEVKEIILKDTSGNGKNTKVRNDNGKFTTQEVNDSGSVTSLDSEGSLSGSFTGSVLDLVATGDATFNDAVTVSGLSSLDGGIDVDGVFTVADSTGNVSTTGTLSAGATTLTSTVDVTGLASLDGGIDVDGAFTVADTTGNVSTSGTLSVTGLTTVGVISGSNGDFTGNLSVGGNLTVAGAMTSDGHIIPALHNTYDLGSTTKYWRDLYLSSGSLYINGIQVLSTSGTDFLVQTDAGENFKIQETGGDTITLETANGDITLTSSGTGNIELDAPIQIAAGKNILSSDGNAISFANDVSLGSNNIYAANLVGIVSSSAITYDGNNVTVLGNLTVQGTQTQLNTATLNIEDKNLLIASGAADAAAANGAGITIGGANQTLTYNSTSGRMVFNDSLEVAYAAYIDTIYRRGGDNEYINLDSGQLLFGVGGTNKLTVDGTETRIVGNLRLDGNLELGDGNTVTSTHTELNLVDGSSAGTIVNSKAVIYGAAGEVNATTLQIGGTSITSTAAELNILDGATLTTSELNQLDGNTVGGTTAGDIVTIDGTQTLTNKTISAAQVTEISNLTADEGAQLENIGTTTISATQWGYLGALDQHLTTGDNVTFGDIAGGAISATSVSATGDIVAYASSDERLKDNIEVISNPIEKVQQLKGVTWDWNDNADELQKSLPNVGVIAQDVEKVLPQLVKDRDNGFKGVDYDKIVGLLIEAIKDQQNQIDELKSKLS